MGSLQFTCTCNEFRFLNSTDNRSYVAYLISEQEWFPFWDAIDEAVEHSGPSPCEKSEACMALRTHPSRLAWQCPLCGALYIEDQMGVSHRFVPESEAVPKHLFQPIAETEVAVSPVYDRLEANKRMGEEAYHRMYEVSSFPEATACYSDAKEAFYDAIQAARELGMDDEVEALEARLDHIKTVFRTQFSV
jgi:hypothetical protein